MISMIGAKIASLVLVVSSAFGVQTQYEVLELNARVTAANKHFARGVEIHALALPKFETFRKAAQAFPADRAELERQGRELAELYAQDAAEYRMAAGKLGEAVEMTGDADLKNYFLTKQIRYAKSAEIRDMLQEYVLLVGDPTLRTTEDYLAAESAFNARAEQLSQEEKDLELSAQSLFAVHRSKFK